MFTRPLRADVTTRTRARRMRNGVENVVLFVRGMEQVCPWAAGVDGHVGALVGALL